MGAIGVVAVALMQNQVTQAEADTADAFGVNVALYSFSRDWVSAVRKHSDSDPRRHDRVWTAAPAARTCT